MNRHPTFFAAVALTLVAAAPVAAQVRGAVTDATSSIPLANVAVIDSARGTIVYSDRQGAFSLPCSGAMTLAFRKAGYRTESRSISACGERVEVALVRGAQVLTSMDVVGTPDRMPVEQTQGTTTLGPVELNRTAGLFMQDELNLTPGIYMQRRSMSGGQTIRIRGYSDGSDAGNFVGTGYKAYLNGMPITDAQGQTILDDIDFASLGRVDVIRGPASSLYGAGIGGIVNFYSARPQHAGAAATQQLISGSDGLLRADTRLSRVTDASTVALSYGHQGYDSYRVHSESDKDYGTFLGDFRPSNQQTVSTFLSYAHSHDLRAGELDSVSFAQELNAGEDKYIKNDARSVIESFRAGVTQDYRFNDRFQTVTTGYYTGNDLEDVYAVGLNSKANQSFGARAQLMGSFADATLPLHGIVGVEFQKTNTFAQGYALNNSVLGAMRSDLRTNNMAYSAFTQWDATLPAAVTLTVGASANFLEYAITDRMANTANPTHLDASGRKTFDPVITPRIGLAKTFGTHLSAYANVSRGYTPPTSGDAVIPYTGEPNAALDPERATQFEVGAKGGFLGDRLSYDAALFNTRVSDKLTKQAVFDTDGTVLYSYTVNGGDQKNLGFEATAGYAIVSDPGQFLSFLRPFATYTYNDFSYSDFKSDNNNNAATIDYSGLQVVGTVRNVVNFGLDARLRPGLYGNATYHHTEGMPISYDNAHWAPGFSLLNAKIGYTRDVMNRWTIDAFVGGDNLTSARYYTQVFLNHKWDSPTPPNMYLPGPYKAKYYTGLKVSVRP
jgi:iron complex outermembrane receptor protein